MNLRCEVIDDYAALPALIPAWRRLCDECSSATAFQTPEWLLAWIHQFGPAEPMIVAIWRGPRLLGLAPLFGDSRGHRRILALLGAGASDLLDVVIADGHAGEVVPALLAALADRRERWDLLELDQLRPASSPLLATGLPPGWSARTLEVGTCPRLRLPEGLDQLATCVPARHLRKLRQTRRRAERRGQLWLERATSASCARLLDAVIALHQARWRERGQPGEFADARVRALHHEAAAALAQSEQLGLYGLYLDDRLIAGVYGFERGGCHQYYLGGFDPAVAALSPGTLALLLVIEAAIRRGLEYFDFLRGAEAYKYWWGAEDQRTVRLQLEITRS